MEIKYYFLKLTLSTILVFLIQILIPGFTGAFLLNQKGIDNYEFWRFVTSIFLHGGIPHLLYNMVALLFFGFILEKTIGSKKFLAVFFSSGIIANLISVNFYSSSLGASGAIMGLIGVLAVLRPFMIVWAFGLLLPMFVAAILWIIGDILGLFVADGVGNIAHLSGVALGIFIGVLLRKKKRKRSRKKF